MLPAPGRDERRHGAAANAAAGASAAAWHGDVALRARAPSRGGISGVSTIRQSGVCRAARALRAAARALTAPPCHPSRHPYSLAKRGGRFTRTLFRQDLFSATVCHGMASSHLPAAGAWRFLHWDNPFHAFSRNVGSGSSGVSFSPYLLPSILSIPLPSHTENNSVKTWRGAAAAAWLCI